MIWCNHVGEPFEGYESEIIEEWKSILDEEIITIWCDSNGDIAQIEKPGAEPIKKIALEWIKLKGYGFLVTSES